MNEFLELVTERPDETLIGKKIFCPYCGTEEVQTFGTRSTLVGYVGIDRNHTHTECKCSKCNKEFTWETTGFDRVWVTDPRGKVLLGIPRCFESYIYTCKHCGGDVLRKYYNVKDDKEVTSISFTVSSEKDVPTIPHQYCVYECQKCDKKVKTSNERYNEIQSTDK